MDHAFYHHLLTFQSISADPQCIDACRACATFLAKDCESYCTEVTTYELPSKPPVIHAYLKSKVPNAPTIIMYNHYDVQPADEPDWISDPFTPTVDGDKIIARGAQDNKGQLFIVR